MSFHPCLHLRSPRCRSYRRSVHRPSSCHRSRLNRFRSLQNAERFFLPIPGLTRRLPWPRSLPMRSPPPARILPPQALRPLSRRTLRSLPHPHGVDDRRLRSESFLPLRGSSRRSWVQTPRPRRFRRRRATGTRPPAAREEESNRSRKKRRRAAPRLDFLRENSGARP